MGLDKESEWNFGSNKCTINQTNVKMYGDLFRVRVVSGTPAVTDFKAWVWCVKFAPKIKQMRVEYNMLLDASSHLN